MATFTESFNKVDGPGLGPDLAWVQIAAGAETIGGEAQVSSASVNTQDIIDQDLGMPDHFAEVVITTLGTVHYCDVQVLLRYTDIDNYYALLRVFSNGAGGQGYVFRRVVGGTLTDVEEAALAFTSPETFRAEVEGNEIRLIVNDVQIDSWIDGNLTTGQSAGLGFFRNSTNSTRLVTVDSMTVGDLGGGAPVEDHAGGSTSTVTAAGQGGGTRRTNGGSAAAIAVTAVGGGTAFEQSPGSGGSTATVTVTATGAGTKHCTGDATATVTVTVTGTGAARRTGGATATVTVTAVGVGFAGELPDLPGRFTLDAIQDPHSLAAIPDQLTLTALED